MSALLHFDVWCSRHRADIGALDDMNRRTWADLDHARAQGYAAFYEGVTPADIPYDEFSGHLRDWWLAGWRDARADDQVSRDDADPFQSGAGEPRIGGQQWDLQRPSSCDVTTPAARRSAAFTRAVFTVSSACGIGILPLDTRSIGGYVFTLAQISDSHLDGQPRSVERLRRVAQYVRDSAVDAVLLSGDISDDGDPAGYRVALELLDLDIPVMMLPGNNDERSNFRAAIGMGASMQPANQRRDIGDTTFLLLDSVIPGRHEGELSPSTVDWLREQLRDTARRTVVCLHHPPIDLGIPIPDQLRLQNPDDFANALTDSVTLILAGHAHTAAAATFAGIPLLVAPATGSVARLPGEYRSGPKVVIDEEVPPMVALHLFLDGGPVTHFRAIA